MRRFGGDPVRPDRRIQPSGSLGPVRKLYDGWLSVERSAIHTMDRYVTESMLSFRGGWIETRQFSWSNPIETICSTTNRCYLLNMSLAGWENGGSARNLRVTQRYDAEPISRIFIIPPAQTMQFNSLEGRSRSIRCALDAELFDSFLADVPNWSADERAIHAAFHISGGEIEWVLRRMYRELRQPDFATPQVIECLAKQLTAEIIRALKLRGEDASRRVGGLAPWRLRLIRQRLRDAGPLPDLDELAGLCDMTVRHLSRAFRTETGQTIGKYVESAMVDRATGMLGTGAPVGDVATALGYATSRSFAAAFRRATGLLPSEVRAAGNTPVGRHLHRPAPIELRRR